MTTTTTKLTNIEIYNAAIEELKTAVDALDQAHAQLRDIGYQYELPTPRVGGVSAKLRLDAGQLTESAMALLDELQNRTECNECCHPLSAHDDRYGCSHERGDNSDGVAAGPCGCNWGQK